MLNGKITIIRREVVLVRVFYCCCAEQLGGCFRSRNIPATRGEARAPELARLSRKSLRRRRAFVSMNFVRCGETRRGFLEWTFIKVESAWTIVLVDRFSWVSSRNLNPLIFTATYSQWRWEVDLKPFYSFYFCSLSKYGDDHVSMKKSPCHIELEMYKAS